MKLDMHCHTAEGSSDGKVNIEEYIRLLKKQGFDGMLVTDHDSYDGYRYYKKHLKNKIKDFVVLRGIEYDTRDAGHMIVVMPKGVELKVLEHKGMPVRLLIHLVHEYGGIVGPAHPCGEPNLSIFSTGKFKKREKSIVKRFDFIEAFNSGEDAPCNAKAYEMATKYDKPVTGGSDAHKKDCVGLAYTILKETVTNENELIAYIKAGKRTRCGGKKYYGTIKERLGKWNKLLVYGFWPYNKAGAIAHFNARRRELKELENDIRRKAIEAEIKLWQHQGSKVQDHIEDLIEHEKVVEMKDYIHHGAVSTYEHCMRVARASEKLANLLHVKKIDRRAMIRGAMLHDFYLYDWHEKNAEHKLHGYHHANKACDNAAEHLGANLKEQKIIVSHMWPLTFTKVPTSKEAWIVCMADKIVSAKEVIFYRK